METPEGFGCVEPGLYRAAAILPECLPFIASLGLKSILTLNPGNPPPAIETFAEATGVELVHMPLQPWRAASDYTTFAGRILRDAVQFVLDKQHYPLLVVDTSIFVGIIRKLENWTFSAILAEYVAYTGVRAHYTAEVYLEMLKVELKTSSDDEQEEETELPMIESEDHHDPKLTVRLPPEDLFPDWFVPYFKLDRESSVATLNSVHVEPTAPEVISSGTGSFWVEVDGKHDSVDVEGSSYEWKPPILKLAGEHTVQFGTKLFSLRTRVSCGDSHTGQLVIGDTDGGLVLYNSDGEQQTKFEGHVLHTSVAKFFPSGQVIVSAGMDFAIKIWDAGTGTLAQTLRYQKGMIDAIEIIERGRNIVSLCSRDSSVVLWEVGGAKVVREASFDRDLLCMALAIGPATEDAPDQDDEYGISGKSLVLGTQTSIYLWDFKQVPRQIISSGASALVVSEGVLVYALQKTVTITNLADPTQKTELQVPTPVVQLALHKNDLFILCEGELYKYNIQTHENRVLAADPTTTSIAVHLYASRAICWTFGQTVYKF